VCAAYVGITKLFHVGAVLMPPPSFAFMAAGGYAVIVGPNAALSRWLSHPVTVVASTGALGAVCAASWIQNTGDESPAYLNLAGWVFAASWVCFVVRYPASGVVACLETGALTWLGRRSYGFYVYHYLTPSREAAGRLLSLPTDLLPSGAGWVLLQLAATLLLSHLSWVYVESRVLAWKRPALSPVATPA
jgi:peptidoglycan/LPS O-acetylase OafA/YrhL